MQLVGRDCVESSAARPRSRNESTSPPPNRVVRPSCRQLRRVRPLQLRYSVMLILEHKLGRIDEGPQQILHSLPAAAPRLGKQFLADIIFVIGRQTRIREQI